MKEWLLLIPWIRKGSKKKYYEHLYTHEFDNLDEMDQFLERQATKIHTRRNG